MALKARSKYLKINTKRLRQERKLHPVAQKVAPKYKPDKVRKEATK
jgi:hypothetical protein